MSNPKSSGAVEALLTLRGKGMGGVGRERIAMLEAAAEQGSITKAAKVLGLSYKTVWDGINAVNNLLPQPALIAKAGGEGGGGAELTEEGRKLILAFRRLEEKLSRVSAALIEDGEDIHPDLLLWGIAMKTSARNAFRCRVKDLRRARDAALLGRRFQHGDTFAADGAHTFAAQGQKRFDGMFRFLIRHRPTVITERYIGRLYN